MKITDSRIEELVDRLQVKTYSVPEQKRFYTSFSFDMLRSFADSLEANEWLTEINLDLPIDPPTQYWKIRLMGLLLTKEEVKEWFINCADKFHRQRCQNGWVKPSAKEFYKAIMGHPSPRSILFTKDVESVKGCYDGYEAFVFEKSFPDELVEKFKEAIKERRTLVQETEDLNKLYNNSWKSPSIFTLFERVLTPQLSPEAIVEYFKDMAEELKENRDIPEDVALSKMDLEVHIFGKIISSNGTANQKSHKGFYKLYYKALFPFFYSNYNSPKQRKNVYDICDYSQEERDYWERVYSKKEIRQRSRGNSFLIEVKQEDLDKEIIPSLTYREFFKEISRIISEFEGNGSLPSQKDIIAKIVSQKDTLFNQAYNHLLSKDKEGLAKVRFFIQKQTLDTLKRLTRDQYKTFTFENDIWKRYRVSNSNPVSQTLDFSSIKSESLKKELMSSFLDVIKHDDTSQRFDRRLYSVLKAIPFFEDKFKIQSLKDISEWQIKLYYHYLESEKGYSPSSVNDMHHALKFIVGVFTQLESSKVGGESPFDDIHFINISKHSKPTSILPEVAKDKILAHSPELPIQNRLILSLLFETGWRYNDIVALKPEDFVVDSKQKDYVLVKGKISKTGKSRALKGMPEYNECYITDELYRQIQNFILESGNDRSKYCVETVFYTISLGQANLFPYNSFVESIRSLCKRNGIELGDFGELFGTRQTRKTVASELINSGASLSAVQKQMGHMNASTTESFYTEVNRHNIGELNKRFFAENFDLNITESQLSDFSEEERLLLYADFMTQKREVELGVCLRHPSEGVCEKLGTGSCASCPKLCTGMKYLEKWERLKDSSATLLKEYETKYKQLGIPEEEYSKFREYSIESKMFRMYSEVVENIKNGK